MSEAGVQKEERLLGHDGGVARRGLKAVAIAGDHLRADCTEGIAMSCGSRLLEPCSLNCILRPPALHGDHDHDHDHHDHHRHDELRHDSFSNTSPWASLVTTGLRAQCRRRLRPDSDRIHSTRPRPASTVRPPSPPNYNLVMEQVHGIDTSWVHTPNKQSSKNPSSTAVPPPPRRPPPPPQTPQKDAVTSSPPDTTGTAPTSTPATGSTQDTASEPPASTTSAASPARPQSRRPSLLQRGSADKLNSDTKTLSRKSSWLNNLGSKFTSSTPERPSPTPMPQTRPLSEGSPASLADRTAQTAAPGQPRPEEIEPYVPSKPKDQSSFFSSITRRFSSASQSNGIPKVQGTGGMCPRRVLNVDPNRERCLVPEMDASRLRKVSFCVDVEIAGGPIYKEEEDEQEKMRKKKEFKRRERAEGEALKHPETLKEEVDNQGESKMEANAGAEALQKVSSSPDDAADRKHDKKKKTDEERRDRLEKRKRRAEENGSIPVEMSPRDDDENAQPDVASPGSKPSSPTVARNAAAISLGKYDRPTTDPVRIYRRCCQLRESPILKRITEQLMSPTCMTPVEPGVVNCLDLTHSRLQLADVVTLGDWLAVVPVKHLKLEDADLNDEGVRCILAGLLAAKRPEPSRRKHAQPKHRQSYDSPRYQERSGVIEKITFKNNPRVTRLGFKYISLFLYMCRSVKAVDLSMNFFPETLPAGAHATPTKSPHNKPIGNATDPDAAETFYKCLCERLGGSRLEELVLSECRLDARQIRKLVDGAMVCGVKRLSLAGNNIDEAGLGHIVHYIRSGVCDAIDVGSNDLRDHVHLIADAINTKPDLPLWGLGLAGCNLSTESLKSLFPALVKLPNFRFLDLSHNRDLGKDNGTVSLFRRYLAGFKNLKRVHLADVGMTSSQAIALADALPDGPSLAHLNILENKQLTALANASNEADQEEACALYASLMAAVRVSSTLICIDIDVPSANNNEIVKALAKQVVAYSLRNMETFAIAEATGIGTADATAKLTEPHGGEKGVKEMTVPDVLMHLVGHIEGNSEIHDNDEPAPDEDYIVGGTGVVKALQYVLGEKASDLRRTSVPSTPISGNITPRDRPGSSLGMEDRGKAKKMSKDLLEAARKIRARLQPALIKEAIAGDDMAYRRLLFLDQTLQSMIQRFEEEYPETRIGPPAGASPVISPSVASSLTDVSNGMTNTELSINTQLTDMTSGAMDSDEEDGGAIRSAVNRRNSDVSLASKALSEEEGRFHRIGSKARRSIIDALPSKTDHVETNITNTGEEDERIRSLTAKMEALSGTELRRIVESGGWSEVLRRVGGSFDDLRKVQQSDPQGWAQFKESQLKARMNLDREKTDADEGVAPGAVGEGAVAAK